MRDIEHSERFQDGLMHDELLVGQFLLSLPVVLGPGATAIALDGSAVSVLRMATSKGYDRTE
jgi:hypothetical protein